MGEIGGVAWDEDKTPRERLRGGWGTGVADVDGAVARCEVHLDLWFLR